MALSAECIPIEEADQSMVTDTTSYLGVTLNDTPVTEHQRSTDYAHVVSIYKFVCRLLVI